MNNSSHLFTLCASVLVLASCTPPTNEKTVPVQWPEEYSMTLIHPRASMGEMKVFTSGGKKRMKGERNGNPFISIYRKDKKLTYFLDPEKKTYIEHPISPYELDLDEFRAKAEWQPLGTEKIRGVDAKKFEATAFFKNRRIKMIYWIDPKTKFPLRRVVGNGRPTDFSNVQPGPQDAKLFEVPADYKKVEPPKPPPSPGLTDPKKIKEFETLNDMLFKDVPKFTLKDSYGYEKSIPEDYSNRVIVLEWINYDSPHVKKFYERGIMQKLKKEFLEKGVVWLAICSSPPGTSGHYPPEKINELQEKYGMIGFPYLIDETGEVARLYKIFKTPQIVVIAWNKLAYNGAIDRQAFFSIFKEEEKKEGEGKKSKHGELLREAVERVLDHKWPTTLLYAPYGDDIPQAKPSQKPSPQK